MKIINIFNEEGKTLQEIMEKLVVDYCLEIGLFNQN